MVAGGFPSLSLSSVFFLFSSLPSLLSSLGLLPSVPSLSVSFFFFSFFFSVRRSSSIYKASERGFSLWSQGASHAAAGRGAAVQACLPRFRRRDGWSASVFGRWSNGVGPRLVGGLEGPVKLNNAFFSFFPAEIGRAHV